MGGASGQLEPFSTTLHPPTDKGPLVLLVYEADASGQGEISAATVLLLKAPGGSGAAAPGPAPTTYVALSKAGDLTHLDFEGHVQRSLATGLDAQRMDVGQGLVAVEVNTSSGCGHEIQFFSTGDGGAATIPDATNPAFSPDGSRFAYIDCGTSIHIRDGIEAGNDRVLAGVKADPSLALVWSGNTTVVVAEGERIHAIDTSAAMTERFADVRTTVIAGRGRFGTVAFFDGTDIKSLDLASGETVPLVTPPRGPVTLDADASGGNLMGVDATGDVWTWSGGEPAQVASGMAAAAW
jgi:hypothetical protein